MGTSPRGGIGGLPPRPATAGGFMGAQPLPGIGAPGTLTGAGAFPSAMPFMGGGGAPAAPAKPLIQGARDPRLAAADRMGTGGNPAGAAPAPAPTNPNGMKDILALLMRQNRERTMHNRGYGYQQSGMGGGGGNYGPGGGPGGNKSGGQGWGGGQGF